MRKGAKSTTGERVVTSEGGFNPTWQRHVAAYEVCAPFLGGGRVLDLGCGIGHSYDRLAARETVGVDLDAEALAGQQRETRVADMRDLPFGEAEFDAVLSVHSIEHVPDPEHALNEARRVVAPGGTVVFVTPNRLTFARADEVIDPYHYVEYDALQLRDLCSGYFESVEMHGIFGSERYRSIVAREHRKLDALLRKDPLRLRRLVPRSARRQLYDRMLRRERVDPDPQAADVGVADFSLSDENLDDCLDLVAVCR